MTKPTNETFLQILARHTDLGHATRNGAFLRQVAQACGLPCPAVPGHAGQSSEKTAWADAMATYRFVGNNAVDIGRLRSIRAATVMERVAPAADVLIVHDVSVMNYSSHGSKLDRRPVGNGDGLGYEYVCCLAVDPGSGHTLGVVHDCLVNNEGPDDWLDMDYDYEPLFEHFAPAEYKRLTENHRHQMAVHLRGLQPVLSDCHPIHVADCEFDDIFLMNTALEQGQDFVLRNRLERNVQIPAYDWIDKQAIAAKQTGHPSAPGYLNVNLKRLLPSVPTVPYRALPVDSKNRVVPEDGADRVAQLRIGSFRVRLHRRAKRNKRYFATPRAVEVNVVLVREEGAPDGAEPICWVLLTSLPVDTPHQKAYVARIYELRWNIEEFFKLLKSGCRILRSQLDSSLKLARQLVVVTLAAAAVTELKQKLGLPAKGPLGEKTYEQVRAAMRDPTDPNVELPTLLLAVIAKKGGWLGRRQDTIGPATLMRGTLALLASLQDLSALQGILERFSDDPATMRQLLGW